MPNTIRVGLMVPLSGAFGRRIWRGVQAYSRTQSSWVVQGFFIHDHRVVQQVANWRPHGVIAETEHASIWQELRTMPLPVVRVGAIPKPDSPCVDSDDVAVGRQAAEYFLQRRYEHFAFVGVPTAFSTRREQGLREVVTKAGASYARHVEPWSPLPERSERIRQFLTELPKPAAVMVCNDMHAMEVAELCRLTKIPIPDEIALMGADNDDLICGLTAVPLSSVRVAAEQVGYRAAAMLHRLIDGEDPGPWPVLVEPLGIVTRQSSDRTAVADPVVRAAAAYIQAHAKQTISVPDVAKAVGVGRRSLEMRFRKALERTCYQEILRCRLDQAKAWLIETDWPMTRIARRCGFKRLGRFSTAFRRAVGQTPTAFRRHSRVDAAG